MVAICSPFQSTLADDVSPSPNTCRNRPLLPASTYAGESSSMMGVLPNAVVAKVDGLFLVAAQGQWKVTGEGSGPT